MSGMAWPSRYLLDYPWRGFSHPSLLGCLCPNYGLCGSHGVSLGCLVPLPWLWTIIFCDLWLHLLGLWADFGLYILFPGVWACFSLVGLPVDPVCGVWLMLVVFV